MRPYRDTVLRPADRDAAFLAYGLMFLAPFLAGAPILAAAGVAFAPRNSDDAVARSHLRGQLRTIVQDLLLAAVGFVCGWAALLGGVLEVLNVGVSVSQAEPVRLAMPAAVVLGLAAVWAICWLIAVISLFLTPALGALRLASGRPAGKGRA